MQNERRGKREPEKMPQDGKGNDGDMKSLSSASAPSLSELHKIYGPKKGAPKPPEGGSVEVQLRKLFERGNQG